MSFKEKEYNLRAELIKAYKEMVVKFGVQGRFNGWYELHTFDYCSNYGCSLDNSTIDKIEYDGRNLMFYYNENKGECDDSVVFNLSDLIDFYDDLRDAMEEEFKEQYNND